MKTESEPLQDSNWVPYQRISKYFCNHHNAAQLQLTDQDREAKDKVCGARGPEFDPSLIQMFFLSPLGSKVGGRNQSR